MSVRSARITVGRSFVAAFVCASSAVSTLAAPSWEPPRTLSAGARDAQILFNFGWAVAVDGAVELTLEMQRVCRERGVGLVLAYLPTIHDVQPHAAGPDIERHLKLFRLSDEDRRLTDVLADEWLERVRAAGVRGGAASADVAFIPPPPRRARRERDRPAAVGARSTRRGFGRRRDRRSGSPSRPRSALPEGRRAP